jgi:HEAT repeat protein
MVIATCVKRPLTQFRALPDTVRAFFGLSPLTEPSSDDIRAKIIELAALPEIIALTRDENTWVRQDATKTILSLAGHGMDLLYSTPPTEPSSDDIVAKIINPTVLPEIIALMKHGDSGVRQAAVNTISRLADRGMSRLRIITND